MLVRAVGSTSKQAHSHCWQIMRAVGWGVRVGAQFSPQGLLHGTAWVSSQHGGWLSREQVIQSSKVEATMRVTALKVQLFLFCNILWLHNSSQLSVGGEDTRAWTPQGKAHWGLFQKPAATASLSMASYSKEAPVWHRKALKSHWSLYQRGMGRRKDIAERPVEVQKFLFTLQFSHSHHSNSFPESLLSNLLKSSHLSSYPLATSVIQIELTSLDSPLSPLPWSSKN